ncbi:MAG TPA: ribonuclease [Croceibacterium sp.]|nr:ribonuclease [Croceibacterium sp.]
MAEWLIEEGIAEHRAVRLEGDAIAEARIHWPGELIAGTVADAVLASRTRGSTRGTVRFPGGEEALVDRLPASAAEGAAIRVEITRPALSEHGRRKLARARPSTSAPVSPTLAEQLRDEGHDVRQVRRFRTSDWDELIAEAFAGEASFPGGALEFSPTPAMLLVDVDGTLDARALALAAVPALADALLRFDCGGSIGVDFPSLAAKADRKAVDETLAEALAGWPHERTAMNGFGFVQIVTRISRPSLLHRATFRRTAMAARLLLRRAEALEGAGALLLAGHPALEAELTPDILAQAARRTGRELRWEARPALAIEAPQAQLVPL